jgi:membrane-associated phospholipid phosphatase
MKQAILDQSNRQLYTTFLIVLVALVVLCFLIPKGEDIILINGNHSSFLDSFFKLYTNLGDGLIFLPVVIILLFVRYEYALIGAIASIFHGLLISLFKRLLFPDSPRPKAYMDNDLIHFVSGVKVHAAHSFPSGHTATAFCLALFVAYACKNKWVTILTILYAVLVGYSRVYLAQHFLIDAVAGAIIGCFTTYSICMIFDSSKKPAWMMKKLSLSSKK